MNGETSNCVCISTAHGSSFRGLSVCRRLAVSTADMLSENVKNKRQRTDVKPSKADGGAVQMLQRSSDADNVLPEITSGTLITVESPHVGQLQAGSVGISCSLPACDQLWTVLTH